MRLTSMRVTWSSPRTWFITARLLEAAAAVSLAGVVYQVWLIYKTSGLSYDANGQPHAGGGPFLDRVTMFAQYASSQVAVQVALTSLLVLAVLGVLHLVQPVSNAGLLRWESFAAWAGCTVITLVMVISSVVAIIRGDPNAVEGGSSFSMGPGYLEVLLGGLGTPVVCGLLLAVGALWWLRLPEEFDEPEDDPVREPRRWRPAPAQDANVDDIVLDGVEVVEPVERLQPRSDVGDGSTPSGYDDYFRRF